MIANGRNGNSLTSALSNPIRNEGHPPKRNRYRLLTTIFAASILAIGIVILAVWYQQDRPLREVEAALKSGRTADAMTKVGVYLKEHPQDVKALNLKARILVEIGRLPDAIGIFRRIGAVDVADLHAWAKAHLLREEWSEALPVLQQLLTLSPNDADGLHEITACLANLGQSNKALKSAERMSTLKGHEARAFVQLGTLHENLGNKKSAAEAWGHVLEYSPNATGLQIPASDFLTAYGSVLLDIGRLSEAIAVLSQSLALQETAEVRLRLGIAYHQTDELEKAVESWRRAAELSPKLREARESLAEVALGNRRYDEARQWLEPLLSAPVLASSTTYLMQRICLANGDREGGRQWQTRTAELHQQEHLKTLVSRVVAESPDSIWARAIRAYRFAESGNWHEAEMLMNAVDTESTDEPFLRQLATSIRRRSTLPALDLLPVHHFQ